MCLLVGGIPCKVQESPYGTPAMVRLYSLQAGQAFSQAEDEGEGKGGMEEACTVMYILSSFLQIHMHGVDMTGLYSSIGQSELPADFGGPHPPLSSSPILNLLGSTD